MHWMPTAFCHRPVSSLDVDPMAYTLHNYEALVNNTDKPVSLGPGDGRCLEKIYQMSAIIAGGEDTLVDNPPNMRFYLPGNPVAPGQNIAVKLG